MKLGVLLFNLGGPLSIDEVKPFLYNLFSDPDILVGVPTPFRQTLAFTIAQIKSRQSEKMYQAIGGYSPQLQWTQLQASQLERLLQKKNLQVRVEVAMRAWNPNIDQAIRNLHFWRADHLIFLSLFPQFSTTTVGSCFKEARRILEKMRWNVETTEIPSWPDHSGYIALLKKTIQEALACCPTGTHVLFSAHSLPLKIVQKGDPYPNEIQRTVQAISPFISNPWSLAFQSRNGRMQWLAPYTENEIPRLAKAGVKSLLVVPISFVNDHVETLYEIDKLYYELAKKVGITHYKRTQVFNEDLEFTDFLANVLQQALNKQRLETPHKTL